MPVTIQPRKSNKGLHLKVEHHDEDTGYSVKEIFIGHRTIFSLIGFTVGGILIGRSLWQYGYTYLGLPLTILIGVILFVVSGIISGQFRK